MNKPRMILHTDEGNTPTALRDEVFGKYGGKCSECGTTDPEVLTFTLLQPNGFDGTLHWLRRHGYPDDRKLICANCKFKQSRGLTSK